MDGENKNQIVTISVLLALGFVVVLTIQYVQNNANQQIQQLSVDSAKRSDVRTEGVLGEIELLQWDFNRKIAKLAKQQKNITQKVMELDSQQKIILEHIEQLKNNHRN